MTKPGRVTALLQRSGAWLLWTIGILEFANGYALEAREVFKLAEPSVVVVLAADAKGEKNTLGSGVLIAALDIVTSCKVVEGAADIVVTQGSALRKARLQFEDKERDLCQLHIDDALPSGKPATIAATALESGQDLFTISAPRGIERTISRTMVSGLRETPGASGRLIQIDAPLSGPSSGGGVFDQNAKLVGILTPRFRQGEGASFAVPAEWIAELARRNLDRLLAAAAPAATSAAPAQAAAPADARPAWLPRLGDRWKYRLLDGKRAVGTLVVEIAEVRDKSVRERITREDEKKFLAERVVEAEFSPIRFQEIVTLPGGYQLSEISPYASPEYGPKAGQHWPDIPVSLLLVWHGKKKFLMQARTVKQEVVRVPAGTFNAMLMEAVAKENLGSSFVTITCRYWYASEMKRAVKMSFQIEFAVTTSNTPAEIYELVAFEPAK